ncbi:hypothetical protein CI109_105674 [Kwoniella shandongensis]|uniref:Uncharacterized protein n=1 Tax=Kwoniella shandongensis TaxID=1734106 RepID=A0A5M6C3S8_9TREE|nr:uncharacterized protein CI109_003014 [Kwoniella shandongensis]KAA5528482.1 hypothetical protein CI109_003014 [Kwoniella shandongensis]
MAAPTSSRGVKKVGKENAPPTKTKSKSGIEADGEGDTFGGYSGEEDGPKKSSKPTSKVGRPLQASGEAEDDTNDTRSTAELRRKLNAMTAERDRLRTQRDTFSKQFEELSKTRSTDVEGLFEKYKQKAEIQAKAQNDIIASQTALTEKLQAKVQTLEKALKEANGLPSAGGPFEASSSSSSSSKADPKEIKALKEELAKVKSESKHRDEKYAQLQREYKAEVEHSRSLQASGRGSVPPTASSVAGVAGVSHTTAEESEKDAACIALYEDLTMLSIPNVKIKPSRLGKEMTFNCIMSVAEQSLNFKLRCYTELDKSKDKPEYVKTVHYLPELLQHEPEAFVTKLDYFSTEFVIPRDQLGGFFVELRSKMGSEEEE